MSGVTETVLREQLLERRERLTGSLALEKNADVIDLLQEGGLDLRKTRRRGVRAVRRLSRPYRGDALAG